MGWTFIIDTSFPVKYSLGRMPRRDERVNPSSVTSR